MQKKYGSTCLEHRKLQLSIWYPFVFESYFCFCKLRITMRYFHLFTGYGWVIVFSCFLQLLLCDGIINAFGVIYLEVIEKFEANSAEVAWILSTQKCVQGLVGNKLNTQFSRQKINQVFCNCVLNKAARPSFNRKVRWYKVQEPYEVLLTDNNINIIMNSLYNKYVYNYCELVQQFGFISSSQ